MIKSVMLIMVALTVGACTSVIKPDDLPYNRVLHFVEFANKKSVGVEVPLLLYGRGFTSTYSLMRINALDISPKLQRIILSYQGKYITQRHTVPSFGAGVGFGSSGSHGFIAPSVTSYSTTSPSYSSFQLDDGSYIVTCINSYGETFTYTNVLTGENCKLTNVKLEIFADKETHLSFDIKPSIVYVALKSIAIKPKGYRVIMNPGIKDTKQIQKILSLAHITEVPLNSPSQSKPKKNSKPNSHQ